MEIRMTKKTKKYNNSFDNQNSVELPVIVTIDVLAGASDSELRSRNNDLENEKDSILRDGYDPRPWEVELAYVQREIDIRRNRMHMHERYIRNNPELVELNAAPQSSYKTIN
jgi:hypothetical protein